MNGYNKIGLGLLAAPVLLLLGLVGHEAYLQGHFAELVIGLTFTFGTAGYIWLVLWLLGKSNTKGTL